MVLALAVSSLLAACQSMHAARSVATPTAPSQISPVQAFVTSAKPGDSQIFTDPRLGETRVTLLKEYPAANGEYCRRFTSETVAHQTQIGVACYDGNNWSLLNLQP
jgi:hypothetical protein